MLLMLPTPTPIGPLSTGVAAVKNGIPWWVVPALCFVLGYVLGRRGRFR